MPEATRGEVSQVEQRRLVRRVVLATDGSQHAQAALAFANALVWPPGATIWVTGVVETRLPDPAESAHLPSKAAEDWGRVLEHQHLDARERAWEYVVAAAADLRRRHPAVLVQEVVRVGEPAAEVFNQVEAVKAQLVMAGSRGHTLFHGLLLGSVSEALVTEGRCPALVVHRAPPAIATVLVAVRTIDDADRLGEACLSIPLSPETRVIAVTVLEPVPRVRWGTDPLADERIDELMRDAASAEQAAADAVGRRFVERIRMLEPDRRVETRVIRGEVAPVLLEEAAALDAALVVVGARERHGLAGRLGLGSVSRKLVRRIPSAILVVREPSDAEGVASPGTE
jgi:nucleotide-binding universal stress UspA family protein